MRVTVKEVPEFSGVGQRLDDAVHEAGVAEVHQPREARQAHLLLLLVLVALVAGEQRVAHGLHHAGRLRLKDASPPMRTTRMPTSTSTRMTDPSAHRGLRLGDGDVLRDAAGSHGVLHPGRGLGGLVGLLLPDPRGLLLGRQAVLAAARLALLHAGRAGGYRDLGATHCTLNRVGWGL